MADVTDFKKYADAARTFDQEQVLSAERSRRLAWTVAGGSAALSGSLGLAVTALLPLKTVQPYVVQVQKDTGVVEVVSALTGKQTYSEAVTKSLMRQYIYGREGYSYAEREISYQTVMLMSAEAEAARFASLYRGSNLASPQVIYGEQGLARIKFLSMTPLGDKQFQVRFSRTVIRPQGPAETHNWLATVTFQFVQNPMTDSDRLINPLGFQVLEYRLDAEAA